MSLARPPHTTATRKTIDNQESGEQAEGLILMSYYALEQTAGRRLASTNARKSISVGLSVAQLSIFAFRSVCVGKFAAFLINH